MTFPLIERSWSSCGVGKLDQHHQNLVMHDFATSNTLILLQLQIKLGFWQQLPYLCFGLAHRDQATARRCLEKGRAMYASSTQKQHPLAVHIFEAHRD